MSVGTGFFCSYFHPYKLNHMSTYKSHIYFCKSLEYLKPQAGKHWQVFHIWNYSWPVFPSYHLMTHKANKHMTGNSAIEPSISSRPVGLMELVHQLLEPHAAPSQDSGCRPVTINQNKIIFMGDELIWSLQLLFKAYTPLPSKSGSRCSFISTTY